MEEVEVLPHLAATFQHHRQVAVAVKQKTGVHRLHLLEVLQEVV
jgi:hypothetical protein